MKKKEIFLNGTLLQPLKIGDGALVCSGGKVYRTSRVVAVHELTADIIRFETLNSEYHLSLNPFPYAVISPLPVSLAACA